MWGKKALVEHMKQCIAMKKAYPHLIAGYDLVGQEDKGRPIVDMTPELFWFKKRCVENGVDLPFFFHAGECLGMEMRQTTTSSMLYSSEREGLVTVSRYTSILYSLKWSRQKKY